MSAGEGSGEGKRGGFWGESGPPARARSSEGPVRLEGSRRGDQGGDPGPGHSGRGSPCKDIARTRGEGRSLEGFEQDCGMTSLLKETPWLMYWDRSKGGSCRNTDWG